MSGILLHAPGEMPWLTACGGYRANVVRWTDDAKKVTCLRCLESLTDAE